VAGEWAEYSFTELIETKALEIGDGYRAKNSELGGDGPIFLRAGHVRDTHIDLQGVDRFHSRLANIVGSKMCQSKDVIVTTKGNSTGRTSYVSEDLPPFVYSPHLSYWRCLDTEIIDSGFLRYWSQSEDFRNQLAGLSASTDMAPYLSLIDQKRLKIALPSIHEQRAIGRFLGALDDKIELNRRMNETLETMARALFKSWFVDFDPIRAKAEGRDPALPKSIANLFPARLIGSELGEIPEGWEVGSLERVAELVRIQTNPFETPEHVFSHCSIPAFDNGQLPLEEAGIAIKSMKFCVVTGTVLFSKLNPTIERVWLVDPQPNESAIWLYGISGTPPQNPIRKVHSLLPTAIPKLPRIGKFFGDWDLKQSSARASRRDLGDSHCTSARGHRGALRGTGHPPSRPNPDKPSSIADACKNQGRTAPETYLRRDAGERGWSGCRRGGRMTVCVCA
jgi:hypothetical protein